MKQRKNERGITLIALVITIIILLILAGISIATLTGENGILAKAITAKDRTKEAEGLELIKLAVNEMLIEKKSEGEDLTLDYIGDHIHEKLKIDKEDVIKNGLPIENVEILYNDYIYQIDNNLQVKVICEIKGRVTIEATYELQGNKAIIFVTAKTEDEQGIKKIILPNDSEEDGANRKEIEIEYTVQNNEEYKFVAEGNNGSTRVIRIKVEGIDLNPPNDAEIVLDKKSEWVGKNLTGTITATVTISDNKSGIDQENCKYIINEEKNKVGIDSSKWTTAETLKSENEIISITSNTAGNKYLHILSVNKSGNKIETVSSAACFVVDTIPPNAAIITPSTYSIKAGSNITVTMSISDDQSGVDLEKCRYIATTSIEKIEPSSSQWSDEYIFDSNTISWTGTNSNNATLYWHVLTYDNVGNYTETVLPNPLKWIATTRVMNYTSAYTEPSGWSKTSGSFNANGLVGYKNPVGIFQTNSLINLTDYSNLSFSINTYGSNYQTHQVFLDILDSSGTVVSSTDKIFKHGSTIQNPYMWVDSYSINNLTGSYYIRMRITVTSNSDTWASIKPTSYIDLIP